jgi:hypothetical protein
MPSKHVLAKKRMACCRFFWNRKNTAKYMIVALIGNTGMAWATPQAQLNQTA